MMWSQQKVLFLLNLSKQRSPRSVPVNAHFKHYCTNYQSKLCCFIWWRDWNAAAHPTCYAHIDSCCFAIYLSLSILTISMQLVKVPHWMWFSIIFLTCYIFSNEFFYLISFQQAHFRCSENWRRRRGSRSYTLPSFRVSSTAASGWWRELWPKTATFFSTTVAEIWKTKRGKQGEGEIGAREAGCLWM